MSGYVSIFEQEWWYQAATDGKWQQVEYSDGRNLTARLVFAAHKRRGLTVIGMPTLARVMQPVIQFGPNPPKDKLTRSVNALTELAESLPKYDVFNYTLPPESELELAYCLAGYTVTANYTFQTDPDVNHDPWAEMDKTVRYNIKAGSKRMEVEVHNDILRYVRLSQRFISNKAFRNSVDYDAVLRIWDACHARKQASILSCVDAGRRDLASAIIIWDDRHVYFWLACRDPRSNDPFANSVLIWYAIEFASKSGLIFDVDGYATTNAGIFLSRFGLSPRRRLNVCMTNSTARLKAAFASHLVEMVGPAIRTRMLGLRNYIYLKT